MTQPLRVLMPMAAVLAAVVVLAALIAPGLTHAFQASPWFNGLIVLVFLIGVAVNLRGVLRLQQEVQWIEAFRRSDPARPPSRPPILLLPMVVAGIVMIIQNSLALAFSLAGIVAGVRFRLTLDDSLDAIYIFVAIGAGLAAGIEALEITVVVSVIFNYFILFFWEIDYGEEVSVNRWFTRQWMSQDPADDGPDLPQPPVEIDDP